MGEPWKCTWKAQKESGSRIDRTAQGWGLVSAAALRLFVTAEENVAQVFVRVFQSLFPDPGCPGDQGGG